MTVKELKEKLEQFPDNYIVMIYNAENAIDNTIYPYIPATCVSRGVDELDGCVFIDDYEEQDCDTCAYYDTDRSDQPCCSCVDWENWERCKDE